MYKPREQTGTRLRLPLALIRALLLRTGLCVVEGLCRLLCSIRSQIRPVAFPLLAREDTSFPNGRSEARLSSLLAVRPGIMRSDHSPYEHRLLL